MEETGGDDDGVNLLRPVACGRSPAQTRVLHLHGASLHADEASMWTCLSHGMHGKVAGEEQLVSTVQGILLKCYFDSPKKWERVWCHARLSPIFLDWGYCQPWNEAPKDFSVWRLVSVCASKDNLLEG
ncbi:hypothetical protein AVEN_259067-1 [Araneus ventricosus]|uniref:Uncharacterized protein n=1 Tax=Araneus ventricosus TaxID=182803 RepID=A0A4Y2W5B1_ARAVE|nr:hypothetical protein AVEN_259067-1 [Araneus ventricosus]